MTIDYATVEVPEFVLGMVMGANTSRAVYIAERSLINYHPDVVDAVLVDIVGGLEENIPHGLGGGDNLACKVAIVGLSTVPGADVNYFFNQVDKGKNVVTRTQPCGNTEIGVGPFAIEASLVTPSFGTASVRVHQTKSGSITTLTVQTPNGIVNYKGNQPIEGIKGLRGAPITADYIAPAANILMPTGNRIDVVNGIRTTILNWDMETAIVDARDFGITGYETPAELNANKAVTGRIHEFRYAVGVLLGIDGGDIEKLKKNTVPKIFLAVSPREGGNVGKNCLIRPGDEPMHKAIGLGPAKAIAWACKLPGTVLDGIATAPEGDIVAIEHPTGIKKVKLNLAGTPQESVLLGSQEVGVAFRRTPFGKIDVNEPRVRELLRLKFAA